MSFSGLRGAVAFYLALNVNSTFKHLIINTTICLIIVTIICLGSTTTCLLKAMAKYFPEDGIFYSEEGEDLIVRRERGISDMSDSLYERNFEGRERGASQVSMGVITRLEKFDMDYGKKFLIRNAWDDFLGDDQNQLDDDFGNNGVHASPDKGKYYDNLSNYQMSVRKYLEESAVNLPYEDRKSVRLSVMSHKEEPGRASYLHPNRNRVSVNRREDYERQMQLSTYGKSFRKSVRREQMSVMSEPRGGPRGLARFNATKDDLEREEQPNNNRLNVPPMNIKIGTLDEISSKGSQRGSKHEQSTPRDE